MASSIVLSDNGVTSGSAGIKSQGGNDGVLLLQTTTSGGTATTAVTVDNAQNVGVGVTPSAWNSTEKAVQIINTSFGGGVFASGSNIGTLVGSNAYWSSAGYKRINAFASSVIQFADGQARFLTAATGAADSAITFTQAMTLDASGNLLVGTTSGSSSARAVIRREDLTSTTKAANTIAKLGPGTGTSRDANIILSDFAAYDYYFGGRGGVAYVTVNNNQGVQLSAGATSWSSDSDETLKDVIEPIKNAIDAVNSWRTVIGKYKSDDEGIRRVFFMAQDIQATTPEAVDLSPEGTLLLRYQDTIPVLAAAIKEQQALIQSLTDRLTALEGAAK